MFSVVVVVVEVVPVVCNSGGAGCRVQTKTFSFSVKKSPNFISAPFEFWSPGRVDDDVGVHVGLVVGERGESEIRVKSKNENSSEF
jgi:hypothetical protein